MGDTLTDISTAIEDVAAGVWDALPEDLRDALDFLGELAGEAWSMLWAFVQDPIGSIQAGFDTVTSTLSTAFDGAMETVGGWVGEALAGVAGALGDALNGFITWLLGALSWIADAIVGAATAIKDLIAEPIIEFGTVIVEGLLEALVPGSPDEKTKKTVDEFAKRYLDRMRELAPEKSSPLPELPALLASAVGVVSLNILTVLGGQGVGVAIDQAHPIKNMGIRAMVGDLVNSFQMPAMIGPLLASPVWPGIIIPLRYRMNEMFPNMIPDVPDLIRFTVREVIEPAEFYATMPFHGFSRYWAEAFWEVHWVLPAFGNLIDAYHREIITVAERDKYIVWHDYKPEARPGIAVSDQAIMGGLTKRLIPRVDLRRGYRIGRLSRAELDERYGWLGYEDDAELQTDIQVGLAFEAERNKLRDNAKSDFVKGYISEDILRIDLATLDFSAEAIDYYVADAVADRARAHKDKLLDVYEDAYQKDLKTYEELETDAATVIVDADALDLFLTEAWIRKYKKPKAVVAG